MQEKVPLIDELNKNSLQIAEAMANLAAKIEYLNGRFDERASLSFFHKKLEKQEEENERMKAYFTALIGSKTSDTENKKNEYYFFTLIFLLCLILVQTVAFYSFVFTIYEKNTPCVLQEVKNGVFICDTMATKKH